MKKIILTISLAVFFALAGAQAAEMNFFMAEETYIADIPFDTFEIKSKVVSEQAQQAEFTMPEEQYIDDIPFDTSEIATKVQRKF